MRSRALALVERVHIRWLDSKHGAGMDRGCRWWWCHHLRERTTWTAKFFDQSSITRFIEDNWGLGRIGNGSFDAIAGDLSHIFDFQLRTLQAGISEHDDRTGVRRQRAVGKRQSNKAGLGRSGICHLDGPVFEARRPSTSAILLGPINIPGAIGRQFLFPSVPSLRLRTVS